MDKTKIKPSISEGWAVHVYDRDRHLRFSLEPSHLWAFSWGLGIGILLAILGATFINVVPNTSSGSNDEANPSPTGETHDKQGI
ncbi:MAG: hypothetical protein AB8B99_16315 [Phormidesmis sp.]